MARNHRSRAGALSELISTVFFVAAAVLVWRVVGLPVVLAFKEGTHEQITAFIEVLFLVVVVAKILFVCVGRTDPATEGAVVSLSAARGSSPAYEARKTAIALLGPDAESGRITDKAREIAKAWETPDLNYAGSCRHEAAHAIAANHFGAIVLGAKVQEDGNGELAWATPTPRPSDVDWHWMRICIGLAGNVLDHMEGRRNTGSGKDMRAAVESITSLLSAGIRPVGFTGSLTFDNILHNARASMTALLSERACDVNRLAQLIEANGELPGHRINALLAGGDADAGGPMSRSHDAPVCPQGPEAWGDCRSWSGSSR